MQPLHSEEICGHGNKATKPPCLQAKDSARPADIPIPCRGPKPSRVCALKLGIAELWCPRPACGHLRPQSETQVHPLCRSITDQEGAAPSSSWRGGMSPRTGRSRESPGWTGRRRRLRTRGRRRPLGIPCPEAGKGRGSRDAAGGKGVGPAHRQEAGLSLGPPPSTTRRA